MTGERPELLPLLMGIAYSHALLKQLISCLVAYKIVLQLNSGLCKHHDSLIG